METKYILGVTDYVVIVFSLLISVAIGIKFRYFSTKQATMREYAMAGKNMSVLPVAISVCVTMLSAITIIGNPAETYRYGMQRSTTIVGISIGAYLTTYIFTPVYFQCGVSSVYEFLELRYGKTTRYTVSGLFIIQMVFFMSSALYVPVLAISAVTDLSLEISIITFGLICAFYCSIGGLKTVLWTDVFQAGFMFICILAMYIKGISEAGGVAEIYRIAQDGQRWKFFELQMDFTTRYTLWNTLMRGFFGSISYFGTSQVEVQRVLSLSSLTRARAAYLWNIIPSTTLFLMCQFLGIIMYSIFYTCDPVHDHERTGIIRYDQIIPYYIVTRFSWFPGLTGVCVAGIFSGSLSTISSVLNSLSTVTVVDFIQPLWPSHMLTEARTVYIAKALTMLYGVLCVGFTFAISKADSLSAVNTTLISAVEGPILAIFLVGILTRKGPEKCILFSLFLGVCLTSWIGYGILLSGYKHPSLPFNSTECPSPSTTSVMSQNSTCVISEACTQQLGSTQKLMKEPFFLYKISFLWISPLGCFTTLFFIVLSILFTGWNHNVIPADSKCLSPVARWWIKKPSSHSRHSMDMDHISLEERANLSTSVNSVD